MADTEPEGRQQQPVQESARIQHQENAKEKCLFAVGGYGTRTHWSTAIWYQCKDGKARRIPAEPVFLGLVNGLSNGMDLGGAESAFPLAGKIDGRTMLLRGYGNAIVPSLASIFIRSFRYAE